ncbi:hypothetical protein M8494_20705 [Serratia ureilytica]
MDLAYAIGLKTGRGHSLLSESKGYTLGFNWHDVEARAHATAFTVAGVLKVDVLEDIRNTASTSSLKEGKTLAQFENN